MFGAFAPGQTYPGKSTLDFGRTFAVAVTAGDAAGASAFTAAAPPARTFTVTATLGDATAASAFAAAAPAGRTFAVAVTAGDATAASSFSSQAVASGSPVVLLDGLYRRRRAG